MEVHVNHINKANENVNYYVSDISHTYNLCTTQVC